MGIPFKEVIYKDLRGDEYTHWVYNKHNTLPKVIRTNVSPEVAQQFNHQDYRVDIDESYVQQQLSLNADMAKLNVDRGENPRFLFDIYEQNFPDGKGEARAYTPYFGHFPVAYHLEGSMGVATARGARSHMEDEHLAGVVDGIHFYAVFDGHGGITCAQHVKKHFLKAFSKWMDDPTLAFPSDDVRLWNAINLACVDTNRRFAELEAGCTAVMCFIIGEELIVANLGDSRAILVTPDEIVQLSEDQVPTMPQHRMYIEGRGGYITFDGRVAHPRSFITIEPARGFGDNHLLGGMYSRPVMAKFPLPQERKGCYLVLACDGVFKVASSRQVGTLVQVGNEENKSPGRIAAEIAVAALQAGSDDNITTLVIPL